jgi:hypothetical protein
LRFVDRHGKGDTNWELPTLGLQAFDDTTAAGHGMRGRSTIFPDRTGYDIATKAMYPYARAVAETVF